MGVEQITGFGCLVCEHHRSVPVVSLGVCGVEERVFQGGGGLLIFILGAGVDVDSQVYWVEQDVARLNRIYAFSSLSLEREHYGGF